MIEIIDTGEVTGREAVEAVNTIKRYCDSRYCNDCVIRPVCEAYFDHSAISPNDWLEMEVPE